MDELPNSELEIMMIIWDYGNTVTRSEVEKKLIKKGRKLDETSILTYLSRLQKRGFLRVEKKGKKSLYPAYHRRGIYAERKQTDFETNVPQFIEKLYVYFV